MNSLSLLISKYRKELFGISAILIMIFHVYQCVFNREQIYAEGSVVGFQYIDNFICSFRFGVDVFVFLSSIGLCYSISKNSIGKFYKNRFFRVVLPYLLLAIPFFAVKDLLRGGVDIIAFIMDVSSLAYWIPKFNYAYWYVSFIIICYVLFPFIYKLGEKTKQISTIILFLLSIVLFVFSINNDVLWYYNDALARLPLFLFGILFVKLFESYDLRFVFIVISLILLPISIILLVLFGYDNICMLVGNILAISFIITYCNIRKKLSIKWLTKFLAFVGIYSFEFYLIHLMIRNVISNYGLVKYLPWYLWYLLIFILSLLLSICLSKISKFITKRIIK